MNSQEVDNVTNTFSLLMSKVLAHERFKCVKSYGGIEEETPLLLLNGCDFFMVTPSSLLRLLKKKQMTLGRLDHLVRQHMYPTSPLYDALLCSTKSVCIFVLCSVGYCLYLCNIDCVCLAAKVTDGCALCAGVSWSQ